jgi:hypothetical protein
MAGETPDSVPYHRFKEVNDELNAAKAREKALAAELEDAKKGAGLAERHAKRVTELEKQLKEKDDTHAAALAARDEDYGLRWALRDLASDEAHFTELVDAISWQHGKLPEKDRPSRVEYANQLRTDPEKAPAILRPLFARPDAGAQGKGGGQEQGAKVGEKSAQGKGGGGKAMPKSNNGAKSVQTAPGEFKAGDVKGMSLEEFAAQLPALAQQNPRIAAMVRSMPQPSTGTGSAKGE